MVELQEMISEYIKGSPSMHFEGKTALEEISKFPP